jgi:CRISPR/Cas system-associated endonuclease Cas1
VYNYAHTSTSSASLKVGIKLSLCTENSIYQRRIVKESRSRSFDRELQRQRCKNLQRQRCKNLQRQRCKNLQRHEQPSSFGKRKYFLLLGKKL